ncbi:hypothetical protein FSP39_011448 [Pinctada imbricata]|uniref:Uncharacterized protein n=1 Tax=Pinctada imbricata TaxID=66713 RepID=A0AA88XZ19_PINIB|nr:hypothetical protein FSP39_011448 [Pinctada imbricata]
MERGCFVDQHNNFLSVQGFDRLFENDELPKKTGRSKSMGVARASSFRTEAPQLLQVQQELPRRGSAPNIQTSGNTENGGNRVERVRSFHMTRKGIVNRGDKLRRKSNISLLSTDSTGSSACDDGSGEHLAAHDHVQEILFLPDIFKVAIVGGTGVGKHTLRKQFMTSEGICTSGRNISIDESERETSVCVLIDGDETLVKFIDCTDVKSLHEKESVDAYLVVFAVDNQYSYREAARALQYIRQDLKSPQTVILVANKADLARRRVVSDKVARNTASKYQCKYVETSVVLNHNVDELLVGVVRQTKLKRNSVSIEVPCTKTKHSNGKISQITRALLNKVFKLGPRDIPCGNLYDL